jgi:double-strand break repair protein MRE11
MLRSNEVQDPFNIFVLHQNRVSHSNNSFISENLLPDFLDLVIWGHEHECLILPEQSKFNKNIHICQPGYKIFIF